MGMIRFVTSIPLWYHAAAVLLGAAVWLWKRRWTSALLAAYAFFLLSLAVLARKGFAEPLYRLRLFWSYAKWEQEKTQILANVAVFIPLGLLLGLRFGWKGFFAGAGFSVLIEVLQLVTCRGVFEFDDMVHNALGTLLGVSLAALLSRRCGKGPPEPAQTEPGPNPSPGVRARRRE